jgi:acetyl esterase/lipase
MLRWIGLLLLFTYSSIAAQQSTIRIWNGLAPGTDGRRDEEKIIDGRIFNVYQPDLTVFLPKNKSENCPAILVLPGGGYTHLAFDIEGKKTAEWLNANGVAAFVLKYRLNPVEALQDAQRAMSLVRAKAKEFGIDSNEIGVVGFSAGGQVAANLATHYTRSSASDLIDSTSCKPDFMILIYPALNWLHQSLDSSGQNSDAESGSFVPFYKLVDKNTPPTFIVHASDDRTVPVKESIDFYTALKRAGVPCELHVFEKGGHGFGLGDDRGPVKDWGKLCVDWMRVNGILTK